jgi:hypothetical protein
VFEAIDLSLGNNAHRAEESEGICGLDRRTQRDPKVIAPPWSGSPDIPFRDVQMDR